MSSSKTKSKHGKETTLIEENTTDLDTENPISDKKLKKSKEHTKKNREEKKD